MSGISIAAAFGAGVLGAPQLVFDGGDACEQETRAIAVLEQHQANLPPAAKVTLRVLSTEAEGASQVEILLRVPGETPVVERQAVNSCSEAFAYFDFYLSLWTTETQTASVPSHERAPTQATAVPAPHITFTGTGFALANTNHPNGLGAGAGVGVALGVDDLRFGIYGAWNQPSTLEGDSSDVASFELRRSDFGANVCLETLASPISLAPCLGASALVFGMDASEAGPKADRHALIGTVDASIVASMSLFAHTALESALLFRYAPQPLDLNNLQVGTFTPAAFEVNLRVGLTWDIPGLLSSQSPEPLTASSEPGAGGREW